VRFAVRELPDAVSGELQVQLGKQPFGPLHLPDRSGEIA